MVLKPADKLAPTASKRASSIKKVVSFAPTAAHRVVVDRQAQSTLIIYQNEAVS